MQPEQAKALKIGQRVKWVPLEPTEQTETGKVTRNSGKHVSIQWDDEDFERIYDPTEQHYGLAHVEMI